MPFVLAFSSGEILLTLYLAFINVCWENLGSLEAGQELLSAKIIIIQVFVVSWSTPLIFG